MDIKEKIIYHTPILLKECIENLNIKEGDVVVDATVNRGGHSVFIAKILKKKGKLICIDLDSEALKEAKDYLESSISKKDLPDIIYVNDNFKNLVEILNNLNIIKIDAILIDLGVSSQEIDLSGRGFTFQKNEPLYMTLNNHICKDTLTAEKIINNWDEENLRDIIYYYGDEKYAKSIAKNICKYREEKKIKTTFDLVAIIEKSVPTNYKYKKIHFATKTFQAIRITVNDELQNEEKLLNSFLLKIKEGGRACVLTFHSGEDRVIKRFVKNNKDQVKLIKFLNKKDFIEPSWGEIKKNTRSRSAKLRVLEKINF